jgi:hypothetical protein
VVLRADGHDPKIRFPGLRVRPGRVTLLVIADRCFLGLLRRRRESRPLLTALVMNVGVILVVPNARLRNPVLPVISCSDRDPFLSFFFHYLEFPYQARMARFCRQTGSEYHSGNANLRVGREGGTARQTKSPLKMHERVPTHSATLPRPKFHTGGWQA